VIGVYIYTRVTTGQQREESHEAQERKVRQLFDSLGIDHSNVVVINDHAERGDNDSRPKFQQLLTAIRSGNAKIVGCDEQSRCTRGLDAERMLKDLVIRGGRFVSCDGVDTDRPNWEDTVGFKQVTNRMEIRTTGTRVRRSQEMRVEKENGSAGDFPYGYASEYENPEAALKYNGRGPKPAKRVIIERAAAAMVLMIFQKFVLQNLSITKIAKWWESVKSEHPGITKTQVRPSHVWRILSNRKYRGEWTFGATTTLRDGEGRKKQSPLRPYQKAITVRLPYFVRQTV